MVRGFAPDFQGVFKAIKSLNVNDDRLVKTGFRIRRIRRFHIYKVRRKSPEAGYDASVKGFARLRIR